MPKPDLSEVTTLFIGSQGSGKSMGKAALKKIFPEAKIQTIQTPNVEGEKLVITVDHTGKVETYYLNPTGD